MIGQRIKDNDAKKPNSREIEKLKETFPQFFSKEGEFELDKFKKFLNEEEIDISKESYGLEFLGKTYAKYLSSIETETYISPDSAHNSKAENKDSENLYIVGDNIDALKHLLNSYAGKIKCIYIDPPYNTGTDGFVYPDNFQFNKEELAEKIGITEEESGRILELAGKSTHSAWLTFMYPRLILARDLLSEDGVIFISIDDNEQGNLKLMCDEIFGEENFVCNFSRTTRKGGGSMSLHVSIDNESLLMYSKNKSMLNRLYVEYDQDYLLRYSEEDEIGKYFWDTFERNRQGSSNDYEIELPNGEKKRGAWIYKEDKYLDLLEKGDIRFKETSNGYSVQIKQRINEAGKIIRSEIRDFPNMLGTSRINTLLGKNIFQYTKPPELILYIVKSITDKNSIVLDFFSGSSTTADAVMQLNAEDGGNRKYIMVQLPEKIDTNKEAYQKGYKTIDEIGRARIEKAAAKIKEETGADIDYGYKLYYLQTPESKTLTQLEEFEPKNTFIAENLVSIFDNEYSTGKESILATWLSEDGYGLSKSSNKYKLKDYEADLIEKSLYIIDEGLEGEDVLTLIKNIENEDLDITRVVAYIPSLTFTALQELRKNLKVLRNNKNVSLIERF